MGHSMRGKKTGRAAWILRGALATLGLAGAVYAADQATAPPASDDLARTITNQKVKEGTLVTPVLKDPEHQSEKLTPDQMIDLVGRYDTEAKAALEHAENERIVAYRSRDIIRMTCIDDKLAQMKEVTLGAEPRALAFPRLRENDLVMRQHFLVLQQARNRVLELAVEIDGCMGDVLDAVSMGRIKEETPTTDTASDPTRPPNPVHDIDRPGEASPYR
jgi:hypothetical protein